MISSASRCLRASWTGDGGKYGSDGRRSERERASSATITVSFAVSAGKSRAFWNARPRPRRARR